MTLIEQSLQGTNLDEMLHRALTKRACAETSGVLLE